jgi:hypothetical protein
MRLLWLPSTSIREDGSFTLHGLAPGQYVVKAMTAPAPTHVAPVVVNGAMKYPVGAADAAPPEAQRLWDRSVVYVASETTTEVPLRLQTSRSISGLIVVHAARPLDFTQETVLVSVVPVPGSGALCHARPHTRVRPDGRFTIESVPPGRYRFLVDAPYELTSVLVNGQEALDFPLEMATHDVTNVMVTLSDRVSELTGRLLSITGEASLDYTIVVAPDDRRYWMPDSRRIVVTRSDDAGRYVIRGLPAGGYFVAALTELESGREYDPAILDALPGASVHVTIRDGGRHVQDLRVRSPGF